MTSPMRKLLAPAIGAAFLLSGCVIQTPQARIESNPELYEALPRKQQELVSRGQIAKGLPTTGVFLALGEPDRRGQGNKDGHSYERWDYANLRPVYSTSLYGSYGYGYGCGRGGYGGYGLGYAPTIDYIRERSATVWFRNGRVDAWEQIGPYR